MIYAIINEKANMFVDRIYAQGNLTTGNKTINVVYSVKAKIKKSKQGLKATLSGFAQLAKYDRNIILKWHDYPDLYVLECNLLNQTFTKTPIKQFYMKDKKYTEDEKILTFLNSPDIEMFNIGSKLLKRMK